MPANTPHDRPLDRRGYLPVVYLTAGVIAFCVVGWQAVSTTPARLVVLVAAACAAATVAASVQELRSGLRPMGDRAIILTGCTLLAVAAALIVDLATSAAGGLVHIVLALFTVVLGGFLVAAKPIQRHYARQHREGRR